VLFQWRVKFSMVENGGFLVFLNMLTFVGK